jgi:hypothetical protein
LTLVDCDDVQESALRSVAAHLGEPQSLNLEELFTELTATESAAKGDHS